MVRALLYIFAIVAAAVGLSWLADRPGELVVNWQGYEIQTSVFRAIVMAALLAVAAIVVWSVVRQILTSPATVGHFLRRRKQERGLEALSAGIIAVGSGDRALASQYAKLAHRSMPNEPLTHLLRAQAAQLSGDRVTARRIYESMRNNPETELLGLRGLYLEAQQEKEPEAARQYAERAVALNPRLGWSVESLFAMQCKDGDWQNALETLAKARKNGQIDKKLADRRRAVLLTAQAVELEESEAARALSLATEAHGLAPNLVPAAAVVGRLLASQGATPKAAKILQRTWRLGPHPDIAAAYAYARIGDSPRDRLARIRDLASLTPHSDEGQIAVAVAAIDAQEWEAARRALRHLVDGKPSQRVCTLMARIEGGQHGDTGKVREWLARAVSATRDPAWIADGHVSSRWAPISPVTGALDSFVWEQPVDTLDRSDSDLLIEQLLPVQSDESLVVKKAKAVEAVEVVVDDSSHQSDRSKSGITVGSSGIRSVPSSVPAQALKGNRTTSDSVKSNGLPVAQSLQPDKVSIGSGFSGSPSPSPAGSAALGSSGATTTPASSLSSKGPGQPAANDKSGSAQGGSAGLTRMQTTTRAGGASSAAKPVTVDPIDVLHAPDDPGPDANDSDEGRTPMTRFRVPASKGPI